MKDPAVVPSGGAFPIVEVQDDRGRWFTWSGLRRDIFRPTAETYYWEFTLGKRLQCRHPNDRERDLFAFVRQLYDMKIGTITAKWSDGRSIEYQHANIKIGDVFDYYTSHTGTLEVPAWRCFSYAVEEYLENDLRAQFQSTRLEPLKLEERPVLKLEEDAGEGMDALLRAERVARMNDNKMFHTEINALRAENSQLVKDIGRKKEELKCQEEEITAQEGRIQTLEQTLQEEEEAHEERVQSLEQALTNEEVANTQRLKQKEERILVLEKQILQLQQDHRSSEAAASAQDEDDGQRIVRFGSLDRHEDRDSEDSEEFGSDDEPGTPPLTPQFNPSAAPSISLDDLTAPLDPEADQVVRGWTNDRGLRAARTFDEELAFDKMHELITKLPYESQEDARRVLTDLLDPASTLEDVNESQILLRQVPAERQAELREFLIPLLKAHHVLRVTYATLERRTLVTDVRISIERRRDSVLGVNIPGEKRFGKDHEILGPSSDNAGKLVPHTARVLSTSNKTIYVSKPKGLSHAIAAASSPEGGSEHSTDLDSSSEAGDVAEGTTPNRKWPSLKAAKFIGNVAAGAKQRVTTFKNSKFIHEGTSCQFCAMSPIVGERYSCAKCVGFHMCKTCYSRGGHGLENSDDLFYRSDELVLARCPRLREEMDLMELMRFEICRSNLRMYTFSLNWVADLINGKSSRTLQVRALEIPNIRRDVRKIFVPMLNRACSHRKDIEIKTELELQGPVEGDDNEDGYLETLRIWVKDQFRSTSPFAKQKEGEQGEEGIESDIGEEFERASDEDIHEEESPLFPKDEADKSGNKDSKRSVEERTSFEDSDPFRNTFVST